MKARSGQNDAVIFYLRMNQFYALVEVIFFFSFLYLSSISFNRRIYFVIFFVKFLVD